MFRRRHSAIPLIASTATMWTPTRCSAADVIAAKLAQSTPTSNPRLLRNKYPAFLPEYMDTNPIAADQVNFDSPKLMQWKCSVCQLQWKSSVIERTLMGRKCPSCTQESDGTSLRMASEKLIRELHPTKNDIFSHAADLPISSQKHLWWRCAECKHTWKARVRDRIGTTQKGKCPECTLQQKGDIKTDDTREVLLSQWHPTRNGELDPSMTLQRSATRTAVWWICRDCAHEWQSTVKERVKRGNGCPECDSK